MATALQPPLPVEEQQEQSAQEQQDYGPNNENLPDELRAELWRLLETLERADEQPRREEIRKVALNRLLFRGSHYWWWEEEQGLYYPPWHNPPGEESEEVPTFQHVTNIHQAFGRIIMAVLVQNLIAPKFWPEDPDEPLDVLTAKNADKVTNIIRRNNEPKALARELAYALWCDGFGAGYVRYVSDDEAYGTDQQPIYEEQIGELAPARDLCPTCEQEYPQGQAMWGVCPQCGGPLESLPAEMGPVPVQVGEVEIPRGREVMEVYGALNIRRSMHAQHQKDFLYLDLITDLHKATGKTIYPHVADKLETDTGDLSGNDSGEHFTRRLLLEGSDRGYSGRENLDLGVYRRAWLRNRAFALVQDETIRTQLQQLFPHGCYVAFYGSTYCESRDESMDAKWVTMHAMPGEGQLRPSLGDILVPVQEQLNDAVNLIFETGMRGVPETFFDQNTLNPAARRKQSAIPGNEQPVNLRPNESIDAKVMQTKATEPALSLVQYRDQLFGPIPQFLAGALPAMFGAEIGKTAYEYAAAREQALGQIGPVWADMQTFNAKFYVLAVKCFAEKRTKDAKHTFLNKSGDFQSEVVALENLQGNVNAYPEVDQQHPVLQSQVRALLMQLIEQQDPTFLALLQDPDNLAYAYKHVGLTEIEIPGEDSRKKQLREIEQLLKEAPVPLPDGSGLGPSIVPDELLDDHQAEEQAGIRWANSEEGQKQKAENPLGFENVKLHIMAHQMIRKQRELQMAAVAQAMSGGGPASDLGGAGAIEAPKNPKQGEANGGRTQQQV